jgi:DNA invertase Pin-like site-specific DNA recombinase
VNAVIYCRVSSKDQIDGTSLESQEASCREYAAKHRLTAVHAFIEQGESAKFADRPQLLALLDYCKNKAHAVSTLIVWKFDRFARNVEDHFAVKALLRRMGVRVVSVTEPIDTDPNGKLMETILAAFAQFDNDIRAMRAVQGMQQRIRDGIFPWNPPLGYLPPKNGKKTVPDRPDPARFSPLQRAWKMLATGAYAKAEILRLLRAWNVRSSTGALLTPQALDPIFANPFYKGVLVNPWTKVEHAGRHVAMVTSEEFDQVQFVLSRRRRQPDRHQMLHRDFPLRGVARCPSCRRLMTAAWSRGAKRRHAYYLCRSKDCALRFRSWPARAVHEEFEQWLGRVAVSASTIRAIWQAVVKSDDEQVAARQQARQSIEREIAALRRQQDELIALRTRLVISDEEFARQRTAVRHAIADLTTSTDVTRASRPADTDIEKLIQLLVDGQRLWATMLPLERRTFANVALPHGYVMHQIRTAECGPLIGTLASIRNTNTNAVRLTPALANAVIDDVRKLLAVVASPADVNEHAV